MRGLSLTLLMLIYNLGMVAQAGKPSIVVNETEFGPEEEWAALKARNRSWTPPRAEEKYGWSEITSEETVGYSTEEILLEIRGEMNQFLKDDFDRLMHNPVYAADNRFEKNDARYFSKGLPVYVSLTTISSRIARVSYSIKALLKGTVRPNRIYLMVSEDPFLLDKGTLRNKLPQDLVDLKNAFPGDFKIIFTKNYGPHRKLLPMLSKFWKDDVLLITVDDDNNRSEVKRSATVANLLRYYRRSRGDSVVALRVRRIGLCDAPPHHVMGYRRYWGGATPNREEFLLLPTGTGGVLYRPRFFHPVVFSDQLRELTKVGDDLTFRIACMAGNTRVISGCDKRTHGRCPILDTDIHISRDGLHEKRVMLKSWKKALLEEVRASKEQNKTSVSGKKAGNVASNLARVKNLMDTLPQEDVGSIDADSKRRVLDEEIHYQDHMGEMRRRLDDKKSLYMVFNRFQANEVAWDKATDFLRKNLVFDFEKKTTKWIAHEREACFKEFWSREKIVKRVRYLLEERLENGTKVIREPIAKMPQRANSCMTYTCPSRRVGLKIDA